MVKGLRRRLVSWFGIVLVLLNVLAPTVSHAVRAHDPQRVHDHQAWVLAVAGDRCVTAGSLSPREYALIEAEVSIQHTLGELQACDFCADPPLALGMPLPPAPTLCGLPVQAAAARHVAYADVLLARPAFERPDNRAPPLL
ncbi:MAG: hypothetical protein RIQ60_2458 [Pseudomonadota bacterium]|jgi:hypothetical protein